jgi:hypothetical protein
VAATPRRLGPLLLGAWALAAGCGGGAHTPEEAFERLKAAVAAHDGARLFDALDLDSRSAWMTVQRAHRECYDITLSNFPEGPDRERQLKRFEAGALAESAAGLFARSLPASAWADIADVARGTGPRAIDERSAEVQLPDGRRLPFRNSGGRRGWGYAGFAEQADLMRRRAWADLDLTRTAAADYERAAARRSR